MAVDSLEDSEDTGSLTPLRSPGFADDRKIKGIEHFTSSRANGRASNNYNAFLGIGEGNVKKAKEVSARNPATMFPYNAAMNCERLSAVKERLDAEINTVEVEAGGAAKKVVNALNNYLAKLRRHKQGLDTIYLQKKCEYKQSTSENERVITENAAAIAAAQQAAAANLPAAGVVQRNIVVAGIAGILVLTVIYVIYKKRTAQK